MITPLRQETKQVKILTDLRHPRHPKTPRVMVLRVVTQPCWDKPEAGSERYDVLSLNDILHLLEQWTRLERLNDELRIFPQKCPNS